MIYCIHLSVKRHLLIGIRFLRNVRIIGIKYRTWLFEKCLPQILIAIIFVIHNCSELGNLWRTILWIEPTCRTSKYYPCLFWTFCYFLRAVERILFFIYFLRPIHFKLLQPFVNLFLLIILPSWSITRVYIN